MHVSAGLWACMFGWALAKYSFNADVIRSTWLGGGAINIQEALVKQEHVDWISPLFRPSSIACAGGRTFLADRFGIFELSSDDDMHRVHCGLERSIIDVAAFCHGTRCAPLALVGGSGGDPAGVVDCSANHSHSATRLLFDDASSPRFLSVRVTVPGEGLTSQRLIVGYANGDLLQYVWAGDKDAWEPEWYLGKVDGETLRGADAAAAEGGEGGRLVLFRGGAASRRTVEVRSLLTMELLSEWVAPGAARRVASGCAIESGFSAHVLSSAGSSPDDHQPKLLRLRLG